MKLEIADLADLRPVIDAIVRATLVEINATDAKLGDRLGYPEAEAAMLMGLPQHVLRDCRLRGEIKARRVGKRYVYSREALARFLDK